MALSNEDVERLYRAHAAEVLRFLACRVLLAEVAVDLLSETFAQAYRDRRSCRGDSDEVALGWIYGIARHSVAAYQRRGVVERQALNRLGFDRRPLEDFEYERIEELAGLHERLSHIRDGLMGLPDEQREALRLRVIEERPYADVAQQMGVSEQAARARVSRALGALRELASLNDLEGGIDHA